MNRAIILNETQLTIKNSIIFEELVDVAIDAVSSDINVLYSDVILASIVYDASSTLNIGAGVISSDPLFVNKNSRDYHLQSTSPCIDAGDPLSVYINEPDYPYGKINLGRYGNTQEATTYYSRQLPFTEDFNNGAPGWLTDGLFGWTWINGCSGNVTPTIQTGPDCDKTDGVSDNNGFYYTEMTGNENETFVTRINLDDITTIANPCFEFWYHMWKKRSN